MKAIYWRLIPFLIFALLVGFFWRGLSLDPQNIPSARLGKPLPAFQLPELGNNQEQFNSSNLRGQVTLLNVWASWCTSCAEEQLFLLQLAKDGVAIYGLNYKDNAEDANKWLGEWGNPYKMIAADQKGKVAIELGVYGTPETFLIDKTGVIRYRHAGVLTAAIWERDFLPRLKELEKST